MNRVKTTKNSLFSQQFKQAIGDKNQFKKQLINVNQPQYDLPISDNHHTWQKFKQQIKDKYLNTVVVEAQIGAKLSLGQQYRRQNLELINHPHKQDLMSDEFKPHGADSLRYYVYDTDIVNKQNYLLLLDSRDEADLFVDLHGESKNTAKLILLDAIKYMSTKNLRSLEIITGVGENILKTYVAEFLLKHPQTAAYKLRFNKEKQPKGYKLIIKQ